jgi:DNA-binding MarR family transcriptional regulator
MAYPAQPEQEDPMAQSDGHGPDTMLQLAELLSRASRRLRRGSMTQLAPLGLTFAQARLLRVVAGAAAPLRMTEIAAQLDVVPRSATSMVDTLEQAGLVTRVADAEDRRSVLVELTESGGRVLARLHEARETTAEEVFGPLSARQRQDLSTLLAALCDRGACAPPGADGARRRARPSRRRGVA